MKRGAVKASQLARTGRIDAPFNLAFAVYRQEVERLCRMGHVRLLEILSQIPPDAAAARAVIRGTRSNLEAWKPTTGYSVTELAVYIAVAAGTAHKKLVDAAADHRRSAVECEQRSELLTHLLKD